MFSSSGQALLTPTGNVSRAVALGDLDRDGDLDAVVAQGLGGTPQDSVIWLNTGGGRFELSAQTLGRGEATDVALADVDRDGDLDVWLARRALEGEPMQVLWINQGGRQSGRFGDFAPGALPGIGNHEHVLLADLDRDGHVDAITAGPELRLWHNTGTIPAALVPWGDPIPAAEPTAIDLADLDQDGDLDLVVASEDLTRTLQVFWNRLPERSEYAPGPSLPLTDPIRTLVVGHFDADRFPDFRMGTANASTIWRGLGDGRFEAGPASPPDGARHLAVGDLDGDGDSDVFLTRSSTRLDGASGYGLNQGGTFSDPATDLLGTGNGFQAALGDLNGDGALDAFVAHSGPNQVWFGVRPNPPPAGLLVDSGQTLGGTGVRAVAVGDLDLDGDLDAVAVSDGSVSSAPTDSTSFESGRAWINQGGAQRGVPGTFAPDTSGTPFGTGDDIALADLDLDGDPDVVAVGNRRIEVWVNQGSLQRGPLGTWVRSPTPPSAIPLGAVLARDVTSVVADDLDGDLDPDLVLGYVQGPPAFLRNLGGFQGGTTGTFDPQPAFLVPPYDVADARRLQAIDFDLDGDVDLLGHGEDGLSVFENPASSSRPWRRLEAPVEPAVRSRVEAALAGRIMGGAAPAILYADGDGTHVARSREDPPSASGVSAFLPLPKVHPILRPRVLALGDLDGDRLNDVLAAGWSGAEVWRGDGAGDLQRLWTLAGQDVVDAALGDLDGDGDLDAFVGTASSARVWLNGETRRGASLGLVPEPHDEPRGSLVHSISWWTLDNARVRLELSHPLPVPVEVRVRAEYRESEGDRHHEDRILTFAPGQTRIELETGITQAGGQPGHIWNPYLGTGRLTSERETVILAFTVLTPGIPLRSTSVVHVVFHHPDAGLRTCFLDAFTLLLGYLPPGSGPSLQTTGGALDRSLPDLVLFRRFRDQVLQASPRRRYLADLYRRVSPEFLRLAAQRPWILPRTLDTLQAWSPAIQALVEQRGDAVPISSELAAGAREILEDLVSCATGELHDAIVREAAALDPSSWSGLTPAELLQRVDSRVTVPDWATRLEASLQNGSPQLRWWAEVGRTFQLQHAESPSGPFVDLGLPRPGTGGYLTETLGVPSPDRVRFYRVLTRTASPQ